MCVKINDKGFLKDSLLGMFEFDVAYIYFMKDHSLLHQWICLSNPLSTHYDEVTGLMKLSISVSAQGDKQIQIKEDTTTAESD